MEHQYPFTNLVFEGGGVRGLAYIGALGVFAERGILDRVCRVAGTSSGSIVATLLAVGYTPAEMVDVLKRTDFSSFRDSSWFFPLNVLRLIRHYGWYRGKKLEQWIENLVALKTNKQNFTFADLEAAAEAGIGGFRSLYIAGTRLRTQRSMFFSAESTPDLPLGKAARISAGMPLLFQASRLDGDLLIDGGLYANYPLDLFDHARFLPESDPETEPPGSQTDRKGAIVNRQTLGLRVDTREQIEQIVSGKTPRRVSSFREFLSTLIEGYVERINRAHLGADDWSRTVFIDGEGVAAFDFDLDSTAIDRLVEMGKSGAHAYLNWHSSRSPDTRGDL